MTRLGFVDCFLLRNCIRIGKRVHIFSPFGNKGTMAMRSRIVDFPLPYLTYKIVSLVKKKKEKERDEHEISNKSIELFSLIMKKKAVKE